MSSEYANVFRGSRENLRKSGLPLTAFRAFSWWRNTIESSKEKQNHHRLIFNDKTTEKQFISVFYKFTFCQQNKVFFQAKLFVPRRLRP